MMPRLSIVIVSFNARAHLVNCLESLRAAPPATSHAIVVVDNASTDGSADAAREFPSVRVIAMARNAGFAAANNAGIRGSSGDLVLLLNSDTIVPPRAIDRLVDRLLIDTAVGIAGPRLVDADGRVELSFGPMISPLNEARQKMIGRLYDARVGPLVRRVERETRREQFVDWPRGRRSRRGCSTNGSFFTRRTWTSATPSARSAIACCSRPQRRSFICAAVRARPRLRPSTPRTDAARLRFTKNIIRVGRGCSSCTYACGARLMVVGSRSTGQPDRLSDNRPPTTRQPATMIGGSANRH